jgi:hypothetical protein
MSTATYERRDEPVDPVDDSGRLPRRPRRHFLNRWSLALTAAVACAAGFYGGVRIEKGQLSGSTTATAGGSGLAALAGRLRAGGAAGAGGSAGAGGAVGAGGSAGAGGAGGPGGAAGAAGSGGAGPAGAAGGAGASFGTITSVRGGTFYITESTGNTVKVKLSSATKITKSLNVHRGSLHPGDTVVIRGVANSSGTLVAATVSDSGSGRASGAGAGSGAGSGSSGGGGLSSLFSAGG